MQGCPSDTGTASEGTVCEQFGYPDMVVEVLDINLYVDLGIASGYYQTTGVTKVPYNLARARMGIYTIAGGARENIMYFYGTAPLAAPPPPRPSVLLPSTACLRSRVGACCAGMIGTWRWPTWGTGLRRFGASPSPALRARPLPRRNSAPLK